MFFLLQCKSDSKVDQKQIQKVLMKNEEMADVFLNSANFAKHTFSTLAPPSGYALNLKALIKVSKVSWTSQLSYEILRSSFKRKFDNTNFISPKNTFQKPASFRVKTLQPILQATILICSRQPTYCKINPAPFFTDTMYIKGQATSKKKWCTDTISLGAKLCK